MDSTVLTDEQLVMNTFSVTLSCVALAAALSAFGPAVRANDQAGNRALRPFFETVFEQAGMSVHVPARPEWSFSVTRNRSEQTVELRTPANYYPTAVIQITRNASLGATNKDLPSIALSAANEIRELSVLPPLESESQLDVISAGEIDGYQDQFVFSSDDGEFDVRNLVGVFPSGHLLSVMVSTPEGQMEHIEHMVAKILRNLKEL